MCCRVPLLLGFVATCADGFGLAPAMREEDAKMSFAENSKRVEIQKEDAWKESARSAKQAEGVEAASRAVQQLENENRALRAEAGADAGADAGEVNIRLMQRLQMLQHVENILTHQKSAEDEVFKQRDQVFGVATQALQDAFTPAKVVPFPKLEGYAAEVAAQVRGTPEPDGSEFAGVGKNIADEIRANRAMANADLSAAVAEHPQPVAVSPQPVAVAVSPQPVALSPQPVAVLQTAAETSETVALKARMAALEQENLKLKENQALRAKIAVLEAENQRLRPAGQ